MFNKFKIKSLTILGIMILFLPYSAQAHENISHKIDICACDKACYTKEVTNLSCNDSQAQFNSTGLPNQSHGVMNGITASNQQFPFTHNHQTSVSLSPKVSGSTIATVAGPIGVAVNGISLFNPDTQGPIQASTGRPPNTYDIGELDECGGHAGRGDDYHYHIAPKCLIEELGRDHVENKKRPIGYAMDGFPILALGWFNNANDIEAKLDDCRGIYDENDQYFYNVKHTAKYDILDCFSGTKARGSHSDEWEKRIDQYGNEIVGSPIGFAITKYELRQSGNDRCHVMIGTLKNAQLLQTNGSVSKVSSQSGTLFYCNSGCYGQFFEADPVSSARGRVMYHERPIHNCPAVLKINGLKLFSAYEGSKQTNNKRSPN